jgi:hypothetical protein
MPASVAHAAGLIEQALRVGSSEQQRRSRFCPIYRHSIEA